MLAGHEAGVAAFPAETEGQGNQPLEPRIEKNSPSWIVRSISFTAATVPPGYVFETAVSSTTGVPGSADLDLTGSVELASGEAKDVTIHCTFKPDRVFVDPDALVLQLRRKLAVVRF